MSPLLPFTFSKTTVTPSTVCTLRSSIDLSLLSKSISPAVAKKFTPPISSSDNLMVSASPIFSAIAFIIVY